MFIIESRISMPIVADSFIWYSDRMNSLPKSDLGRFSWHQRGEAGHSSDGLCDFALREWGGCECRRGAAERPSDSDLFRSHKALGRQACDTTEMGGAEESARRRGKTWIPEMPETSGDILTFFLSFSWICWTVELVEPFLMYGTFKTLVDHFNWEGVFTLCLENAPNSV